MMRIKAVTRLPANPQGGVTALQKRKFIFKCENQILNSMTLPMGGQRLAEGHQNWIIIDFTYYGDRNLFGRTGSDNVGDNISDQPLCR